MTSFYDHKVTAAQAIVEEHNSHIDEADSESRLSWDDILIKLKKRGGTTEETLREMTWEDIQDCGVPRILARRIANQVFRQTDEELTADKIAAMSFIKLFESYDPTGETNSAVRDRLKAESDGRRCVVFDPSDATKILVLASVKALRQLKDGLPEQESVHITQSGSNGKVLAKLYKIGETPNEFVGENFLYPGKILRDGVCDNTGRNLDAIPVEAQQIVYLAITATNEVTIDDVEAAHRVLDTLECDDPVGKAQSRYGKATLRLQELKLLGNEPKLLLRKNGDPNRSNNPFNTGSHVRT